MDPERTRLIACFCSVADDPDSSSRAHEFSMTWMLSLALDAWCSRVCAIVFGVIFGIHTNTQNAHAYTHAHTNMHPTPF